MMLGSLGESLVEEFWSALQSKQFGETYSVSFTLRSPSHSFENLAEPIKELRSGGKNFLEFTLVDQDLRVSINRPRFNFFDPAKDGLVFIRKMQDLVADYAIGLSIYATGFFFPFELGKLDHNDLSFHDSVRGPVEVFYSEVPERPASFNREAPRYEKQTLDKFAILFPVFWTALREKREWDLLHVYYRKGLMLLSQNDSYDQFTDEAFLLFYKALENLVTFDVHNRKKLDNELRRMLEALARAGAEIDAQNLFKELYQTRCSIAAHGLARSTKSIPLNQVYEIKFILDMLLFYEMLPFVLGEENITSVLPREARL